MSEFDDARTEDENDNNNNNNNNNNSSTSAQTTSSSAASTSTTSMLQINSEHRLRQENLCFDIDVWYPLIRAGDTARTVFVSLRRCEVKAIVSHYRVWQNIRNASGSTVSDEEFQALLGLQRRIEQELKSFGSKGAFLRLCGRSPKDSLLRTTRDEFDALCVKLGGNSYNAMNECRRLAMRVKSSSDVMWNLLTSERVFADALDVVEYGEPEQIVLREWDDDMRMSNEFRTYVADSHIIAISQYDHYGYYPSTNRFRVQAAIERAVALLDLGVPSFVADFLYVDSSDSCRLIELSPFRDCTGPAMFTWTELFALQRQRQQTTSSSSTSSSSSGPQIEFRMASQPRANLTTLMENWIESNFGSSDLGFQRKEPPFFALCTTRRLRLSLSMPSPAPLNTLFFFYGTLKQGFHWSSKYLGPHLAKRVGAARTVRHARLVVGDSGVPYCFGFESNFPNSCQVIGELWKVSDEGVTGLDDYEGVGKGHYIRRQIDVQLFDPSSSSSSSSSSVRAFVYEPNEKLHRELLASMAKQDGLAEYTLELHNKVYRPIAHIYVKQAMYLDEMRNEMKH